MILRNDNNPIEGDHCNLKNEHEILRHPKLFMYQGKLPDMLYLINVIFNE